VIVFLRGYCLEHGLCNQRPDDRQGAQRPLRASGWQQNTCADFSTRGLFPRATPRPTCEPLHLPLTPLSERVTETN
jgi:hypothetical protein